MSWLVTAPGRMTARLAAMMLVLEAMLVLFASLVALRLSGLSEQTVWIGGGVLALACLLTCGVVRRPGGMAIGTVLQVIILATGLFVPGMWLMGGLFVGLWLWMGWIGQKIDTERAAAAAERG